jgi:hypothetical protein
MFKLMLLTSLLTFSFSVMAQKKVKMEKAPHQTDKVVVEEKKDEVDEADQVITNRRLRADMGSTSNWSIRTFWNYQGGSVQKPFTADRPNIDAGGDNLLLANASGNVGVRYRVTKFDSLNLNFGLNMTTPFHSSFKTSNQRLQDSFDKNRQKITANDPALTYNKVASIWGFQVSTNASVSYITNAQLEQLGYRTSGSISTQWMKDLGGGWTVGPGLQMVGYTFNSRYKGGDLLDRSLVFFPAAEYVINDKLLWRAVYRVFTDRLNNDDSWTYKKRTDSISTGIGISITRDIFLYPNVQFIPEDIRSDRTNVAMSANINLF